MVSCSSTKPSMRSSLLLIKSSFDKKRISMQEAESCFWIFKWFFFSCAGCPLLPAGCMDLISSGYATAEPATVLLMGSNLTVYCHTFKCEKEWAYLLWNFDECRTYVFLQWRIWQECHPGGGAPSPSSLILCLIKRTLWMTWLHIQLFKLLTIRGGLSDKEKHCKFFLKL